MNDWPKKWIAVVLSVLFAPLGMLYVGRPGLAFIYFVIQIGSAIVDFVCLSKFFNLPFLPITVLVVGAFHVYRLAGRYPAALPRPRYSRWYGLLAVGIGVPACAALSIRSFIVEPFVAPSRSMVPTLKQGDFVIVQKWGYGNYGTFGVHLLRRPISLPLDRGDIIVFEYPLERPVFFLKRLIGLPGDKVSYRKNKLSINDIEIQARKIDDYPYSSDGAAVPQYRESISGREYSVLYDPVESLVLPMRDGFVQRESCTPYPDGLVCIVPAGHYFVLGDNRDRSSDSRSWGLVPADHIVGKVVDNLGAIFF